jgi:stage II sporulation protein D
MRYFVVAIFSLLFNYFASSQNIKISVLNAYSVQNLTFSVVEGSYLLKSKVEILDTLYPSSIYYITFQGNSFTLNSLTGKKHELQECSFLGRDSNNVFQLKAINPSVNSRSYDDDVHFSIAFMRLQMTNELNIDKYIAGVVEAESGAYAKEEFYKAQALLCRTYALKNIVRHGGENFNLCDEVHCQAFKGRNRMNPLILKATKATHNMVVVDSDSNFITAAFHANSGGETCTADHVWISAPPYLQAISDPYSLGGRGAKWTREIKLDDWKRFLENNNMFYSDKKAGFFLVENSKRNKYYKLGNQKIMYNKIREEFKLKSAYFSVTKANNQTLLLKGKGYGHGIGMSQEGAMQMAKEGKSAEEIINFYFKDVSIVNLEGL